MSSERGRPSLRGGAESENEAEVEAEEEEEEEEAETTSKSTRLLRKDRPAAEIKRRKRKKDEVDMTSAIGVWATSLKGPHLDLMVALKQLAEVRLMTTRERSLSSCLTPASLRTIGIVLEELIKDRMGMECLLTNTDHRKGQGNSQSPRGSEGSFSQAEREEQGAGT